MEEVLKWHEMEDVKGVIGAPQQITTPMSREYKATDGFALSLCLPREY